MNDEARVQPGEMFLGLATGAESQETIYVFRVGHDTRVGLQARRQSAEGDIFNVLHFSDFRRFKKCRKLPAGASSSVSCVRFFRHSCRALLGRPNARHSRDPTTFPEIPRQRATGCWLMRERFQTAGCSKDWFWRKKQRPRPFLHLREMRRFRVNRSTCFPLERGENS